MACHAICVENGPRAHHDKNLGLRPQFFLPESLGHVLYIALQAMIKTYMKGHVI